jgi:hypothetical protein
MRLNLNKQVWNEVSQPSFDKIIGFMNDTELATGAHTRSTRINLQICS